MLKSARKSHIKNIVFLSVQGAEKSQIIPHNKIERLIQSLGFNYIFVRPSYFMQNLTTTLRSEITNHQRITLPAGNAKFNWVDARNIGEATAVLLTKFEHYQNQAYEITGTENLDFEEAADVLTKVTQRQITYKSINPIGFYFRKRKEGMKHGFALVMTVLHFLPRFQAEPQFSRVYKELTGKAPTTLREFVEREKDKFLT